MQQQWLFSQEDIAKRTPSVSSKAMSTTEEKLQRGKAVRFITEVAYGLQLPQCTVATASAYVHRFFMRRSIAECPAIEVAAAALFLACKTEETMRRSFDFVSAVARTAAKNPRLNVDPQTKVLAYDNTGMFYLIGLTFKTYFKGVQTVDWNHHCKRRITHGRPLFRLSNSTSLPFHTIPYRNHNRS